ncbi:hypothetical protein ACE1CI_29245 [Aerosakkonemataceae cyanobacterium BLCC-F50]|uniref:Uncharacterized protein n=1 Tax=Floridaenema flaviceps BLCC-F50 TaxID=3153642 RepID=A0ABV4XZW6_9CYAN
MNAHKIETTLTDNGTLLLKDLPFQAGDSVEIIILKRNYQKSESNPYPLQGTVYRYEDPCEPATPLEDWEALQ